MDANGYNESLLPSNGCYICGIGGDLARHEVFEGINRRKSKADGMWVTLCPECHARVHQFPKDHMWLKKRAQKIYMEHNNVDTQGFIERYGRNYA